MFGSRKRMKRTGGRGEDEEDGAPTSKKRKGIFMFSPFTFEMCKLFRSETNEGS